MALNTEQRMNLAALQRVDIRIIQIIDNASQVALYKFNQRSSEWEKTEIEGTFFIFLRSVSPEYGFIVMNRLSTTNLIETISADLEFQLQCPFLLYKNSTGQIYGIWFYDEIECVRIEVVLNRLAQSQLQDNNKLKSQRQRCASEGDQKLKQSAKEKSKAERDILSLLSQAQEEYDKQQKTVSLPENPAASNFNPKNKPSEKKPEIIKPTPLRIANGKSTETSTPLDIPNTTNQGTSLNLATLFAQAKATQHGHISPIIQSKEPGVFQSSEPTLGSSLNKPVDLQRLLSNPANTVEHIEKIQLNETTKPLRDRATSCSGGMEIYTSAENLEKDLKEKLKLKTLPIFNQNNSFLPGTSLPRDDVFLSNDTSRQHLVRPTMAPIVQPANMAPIVPAPLMGQYIRTSPLVPISTGVSDPFLAKSLLDECDSPIITPAMLEESMESMFTCSADLKDISLQNSFPTSLPLRTSTSQISPLMFTQPLSNIASNPIQPNFVSSSNSFNVNGSNLSMLDSNFKSNSMLALTKDHLKESLVYLLQNDDDFLSKVHEGYIASLKSQLTRFGPKS